MKLKKKELNTARQLYSLLGTVLAAAEGEDEDPPADDNEDAAPADTNGDPASIEDLETEELRLVARQLYDWGKLPGVAPQSIARRGREKLLELVAGVHKRTVNRAVAVVVG